MQGKDSRKKLHLINEEINHPEVLLVSEGSENRLLPVGEALEMARAREMDLVLINGSTTPAIVKILNYGKFLYEIKKNKKHKKNVFKLKSITVKPQISEHDIEWKSRQAIEWFSGGDTVQLIVRTPGRMADRMDVINEVYNRFCEKVGNSGSCRDGLKKISKIQYSARFVPTGK